ncbi:hypothetical protein [Nocardiopsis deserti]|uniref:hypothetical protein n=1 Tax=Nocardiopsis deserti TaxID=2605988 RepID=UPI00123A7F88|nr:hypothetical protein [Nocardiopsis deserti]
MESVNEILRWSGVPEEEIPASQDRWHQRLRGEFARRGAVAVMADGPSSVNDVLPFVATSPGSLTLVATAHDLDLGEALSHVHDEVVELDALDEEHSAELLCAKARLVPGGEDERAAVAALVRLAGGGPELLLRYGRRLSRARRRMGGLAALEAVYREAAGEEALPGGSPGPGPRGPKEGRDRPRPVGAGNDADPGRPSGGGTSGRGPETGHGGSSGGGTYSVPNSPVRPAPWYRPLRCPSAPGPLPAAFRWERRPVLPGTPARTFGRALPAAGPGAATVRAHRPALFAVILYL